MTPEEQFLEQNGMTVEQAWEKVETWATTGKIAEAKAGCAQILKLFPEHTAKKLLAELETPAQPVSDPLLVEIPVEKPKPTLSEKLKGAVSFVITGKKPAVLLKEAPVVSAPEGTSPEKKEEPAPLVKPVAKSVNMVGVSTSTPREIDESLPEENSIEDDERMFGAISYIPFLCFFTLSSRKDSRFVQYHAWQGFALLAIFLVSLPVYFLLGILTLFVVIFWILYLFFFGLVFFAMWTAWNGNYLEIPFISHLARTLSGRKKD
ncbi:MAG: hypothetical protein WCJ84_00790 [Candidatus Peregrinibacteria bacterium]